MMKMINRELLKKDWEQMKEFNRAFKLVHGNDPSRRENINSQERAIQYMEHTMRTLGVEFEDEEKNKKI
ncbi:MAG: hypothetical protein ACRCXT_10145 [Paraclostridium sp.]